MSYIRTFRHIATTGVWVCCWLAPISSVDHAYAFGQNSRLSHVGAAKKSIVNKKRSSARANCIFIGGVSNNAQCYTKVYNTYNSINKKESDNSFNQGILLAGSEPSPESRCSIPSNAVAVYFGSNVSWTTSFPFDVIRLGASTLTVTRSDKGISVKAFSLLDDKGHPLIYLNNDGFNVPESYNFQHSRNSILIKTDSEILFSIKYINPKAISVEGTFALENSDKLFVFDGFTATQSNRLILNSCWGNRTVDLQRIFGSGGS